MAQQVEAQQHDKITVFLCTSKKFEWGSVRETLAGWNAVEVIDQVPETKDPVAALADVEPGVIMIASDRRGQPICYLRKLHGAA